MKNLILIVMALTLSTSLFAKTLKSQVIEAKVLDQICEQSCVLYVEESKTGHIYGLVVDEKFADVAELNTAIQTQATVYLPLASLKSLDKDTTNLLPQGPAESFFDFSGKSLAKLLKL